jgi:hypothetical protein
LSYHSTSWNGGTFPAIGFPASSLAGASIFAIFAVKNRSSWVRYWQELKEVLATQGQRTSPMHNPQFPSFHEADTQLLF